MKHIKIYTSVLLIAVLGLVSCSDFTDGINDDPNAFTSAPADLLLGNAQLAIIALSESQSSRVAGIFTDQFTGDDRQFIALNQYTTSNGDYDDIWNDIYVEGAAQADLARQFAIEEGNTILEGISEINLALLLGETAALFGDVPYTEAFNPLDFPEPSFDSQLDVLAGVQDLLSSGISKVGAAPVTGARFVGNSATWSKVAHSLKARYYLITKNYPLAYSESKLGISSTAGDLNAVHAAASGARNLYYQFIKEQREGYLNANASHLNKLVNGITPRILATPGDTERAAFYFTQTSTTLEMNTNEGGIFAQDASFPIISYLETKFIEAEAAQRTGEDALTPFNAVRTELASVYSGSFPATNSTGATLLNEILEEKYITMVGSLQVYHDTRRTGNLIGIPIKNPNTSLLPQRFLYPQTEINSNTNTPTSGVGQYDFTKVNQ